MTRDGLFVAPPPGAHTGVVSYGPVLSAAAVLLTCYENVPPERATQFIGMLLGTEVSTGWVDKAAARVKAKLGKAGFDDAIIAALAGEDLLAADETPVSVQKTAPALVATAQCGRSRDYMIADMRSYLDLAAAHGITALYAITSAIAGQPWLPPLPALA